MFKNSKAIFLVRHTIIALYHMSMMLCNVRGLLLIFSIEFIFCLYKSQFLTNCFSSVGYNVSSFYFL